MFVGCMFLGIGIGYLVWNVQAWTLIGMCAGFIVQKLYDK